MKNYHVSITRKQLWFRFLPLYFFLQFVICGFCFLNSDQSLLEHFSYLDSTWYVHLSSLGYIKPPWMEIDGGQFAFLPLWPIILSVGSIFTFGWISVVWIGTVISALSFLATMLILRLQSLASENPKGLLPETPGGWFLLVFCPGSWVYFSNHTEALFLLLSVGAFAASFNKKFLMAAILAGLAAVTRNQGTILALSVGISFLFHPALKSKQKMNGFLAVGFISSFFYALWLYYQYTQTGNFFASAKAQEQWSMASSASEYFSNMFWLSPNNGYRALVFWASLFIGGKLTFQKQSYFSKALGVYVLLSVLLWPLQGNNFPQAYRFGAVLFPVWFILGDFIFKKIDNSSFKPKVALAIAGSVFLFWGTRVSFFYFGQTGWPY